jgi:hypothetical protein
MDGLGNNLLANGVLAAIYVIYKIVDRCLHSRCKYTKLDGFAFDMDGEQDDLCPATDLEKVAEMLKARAGTYMRAKTARGETRTA